MKIYKNPYVERDSFFTKTGKANSARNEGSKSKGYSVDYWDGKWIVREATYYDSSLMEMQIVAENNISIQKVVERAILDAILDAVGEAKRKGVQNEAL